MLATFIWDLQLSDTFQVSQLIKLILRNVTSGARLSRCYWIVSFVSSDSDSFWEAKEAKESIWPT